MTIAPPKAALSARVRKLKPSTTLAVTARVKELKAQGVDVIGFGAGEPDFGTPEAIRATAVAALAAGRTRYEPVPGPLDARTAIAEKLAHENGIACGPDDVVINSGAKQSIYLALLALVDPGREVVVPTPAWVSYRPMVELCEATVVEVPGAVEHDFRITPAQLDDAITPRTAAVLLNSPSNPCGTMYTPAEIRAFAEILVAHEHVFIISDEIYERLVYGDVEHFSIGSMPALADRVVTVNGLSKSYAMTGWRLGYACAPGVVGGQPIAKAIAKLQGQMTSHPTSFCLPAIAEALRNAGEDVESMRRSFAVRGALMHERLIAIPGIRCPRPTGAFYAFPDVGVVFGRRTPAGRTIDSAVDFAEALLEEVHVAVVPGDDFGACARTHVRLSFACSNENIEEGCKRLAAWMASLE